MSLATLILIILGLVLVGVLPTWQHARSWGFGPSGALLLIMVVVLMLVMMGAA